MAEDPFNNFNMVFVKCTIESGSESLTRLFEKLCTTYRKDELKKMAYEGGLLYAA